MENVSANYNFVIISASLTEVIVLLDIHMKYDCNFKLKNTNNSLMFSLPLCMNR